MQNLPVSHCVFVGFDTETTGRNPVVSKLVEISGVKFLSSGETLDSRSALINPQSDIPPEVTLIHGITNEMVADSPTYAEVVPDFVQWMTTDDADRPHVLVAHNAPFDVGFIQVALSRLRQNLPKNPVLDTLALSRKLLKDAPNHKLKTLMEHLEIETSTYHRAEADSEHVRDLMLSMLGRLSPELTLGELAEIGGLSYFSDPFVEPEPGQERVQHLASISKAIEAGEDLKIKYNGKGIRSRTVTPLSVLYCSSIYYLSAYCHAAQDERTFRIDKIAQLELVKRLNHSERIKQ